MAQQYEKWTPAVVEELLFRQFMKGEDVSALLPPTPAVPSTAFEHDDTVACMFKFLQHGPNVAQVSGKQAGVNAANFSQPVTPAKAPQFGGNGTSVPSTPTGKPPLGKQPPATPPPMSQVPASNANALPPKTPKTPKDKKHARAEDSSRPATPAHMKARRRKEFDWPQGLPADNDLKPKPQPEGAKPVSARAQLQPATEKRVEAQDGIDPDLIFKQQPGDFPLTTVFQAHPSAMRKISSVRGLSGDWRNDTFSAEMEAKYKADMGYTAPGPSQAMIGGSNAPLGLF